MNWSKNICWPHRQEWRDSDLFAGLNHKFSVRSQSSISWCWLVVRKTPSRRFYNGLKPKKHEKQSLSHQLGFKAPKTVILHSFWGMLSSRATLCTRRSCGWPLGGAAPVVCRVGGQAPSGSTWRFWKTGERLWTPGRTERRLGGAKAFRVIAGILVFLGSIGKLEDIEVQYILQTSPSFARATQLQMRLQEATFPLLLGTQQAAKPLKAVVLALGYAPMPLLGTLFENKSKPLNNASVRKHDARVYPEALGHTLNTNRKSGGHTA